MKRCIHKRIKLLSGIAAALMLAAFVIGCKSNISMPKVAVMGVTLDKIKLSLEEEKNEKLTATVKPTNASNKKVTWSSDKPEVAEVGQDGTVTAKKAGTANITVKTEDGDKTAVCAVTVKAKTPQPVQKYTVTLTQPVHGSVTTDPAIPTDKQVVEGTEITFTAKADAGYHVDTWSITGGALQSGGQPGNTTATVKITTNTTVQVTFKKQDPMGTYVTVPFGANGETLNTYLKDSASEANINYIKVTGLTKEKLRGSYPNASELGEILKKHPGKKVAITFDDAEIAGLTDMRDCFYGCTDLTQAPQIPTSVTNMTSCFHNCTSLKQAPQIPANVTDMGFCFAGCTSLTQAPNLPANVTNMHSCFSYCTSLTQAPHIPANVTNMGFCFSSCTSLTQAPQIPANVTNMYSCFSSCTKLISVTLKCRYNNDTYSDGDPYFKDAFKDCSSLRPGTIKVPVEQFETYKSAAGIMGTTADRFAKDE